MSEQLSLSWNILMEAFTFYFIKLSHLLEYPSIFKHYLKKHTILCKIVMATTVAEINCSKSLLKCLKIRLFSVTFVKIYISIFTTYLLLLESNSNETQIPLASKTFIYN